MGWVCVSVVSVYIVIFVYCGDTSLLPAVHPCTQRVRQHCHLLLYYNNTTTPQTKKQKKSPRGPFNAYK